MSDRVELRIKVDDGDDLAVAERLSEHETDLVLQQAPADPSSDGYDPQIMPIVAVLIGAGVLTAAKFVKDWWKERGGGLVIDQRKDAKDDIYRDKDLEYGYVVIFPADGGKVEVEIKDAPKDAEERLIGDVISGGYKTVTDLANHLADQSPDERVRVVKSTP